MMYKIKGVNEVGEWDVRFWHGRGAFWDVGWKGRYSVALGVYHFPYLRYTSRYKKQPRSYK